MKERQETYRELWEQIREIYTNGYCVSERGLQAALYAELARTLPTTANVVVEPTWEINGSRMVPDLIIVEDNLITNIFELKFVPHHYANLKDDVRKLLNYGNNPPKLGYPVRLNPADGKYYEAGHCQIHGTCHLHFVAVANYDAAAVWPASLKEEVPELSENPGKLNHWYGRIGGDGNENARWSIEFGI